MSVKIEKLKLPVDFESNESSDDSRFKKVKIWIAHTGENLNNSYFEKTVLADMAKTLSGIPIVGFLEQQDDDEDDFSDHRQEITIKKDGIRIRYAGHAYGFIPKENNYSFEFRDGKEWLTAEGYVWTKFTDAMSVFEDSNGVKSQSMEISDVEAVTDDIGRLDIQSAIFSALCILGEDVSPAMSGSTIEFFSNKKGEYQAEVDKLMTAFALEKGVDGLVYDELKDELETTTEVVEDTEDIIKELETETENVLEYVEDVEVEEDTEEESAEGDEPDVEEEPASEPDDELEFERLSFDKNFELSHGDVADKLRATINERLAELDAYGYIDEIYDNYAFVRIGIYSNDDEYVKKTIKIGYEKTEDKVNITSEEEVFQMYLSADEKDKVVQHRDRISELEAQLAELNEFKNEVENEQKEELLADFSERIGDDKIEEIRSNLRTYSISDVEKELGLALYYAEKESKKEQGFTAVPTSHFKKTQGAYGELDKYFTK